MSQANGSEDSRLVCTKEAGRDKKRAIVLHQTSTWVKFTKILMQSVHTETEASAWKKAMAGDLVREKSEQMQNHIPTDTTGSVWKWWFHFSH